MIQKLLPEKFYGYLYKKLENITPLECDCGKLCGGACCKVTDEITGMYLFPCEYTMFSPIPRWGKIYDTDFKTQRGYIDLFTCDGTCDRKMRPLSCRIFPLVPYAKRGGKLEIIIDPRGRGMCPLSIMQKSDLRDDFCEAVYDAMALCMNVADCREFIYSLSENLDEMINIL